MRQRLVVLHWRKAAGGDRTAVSASTGDAVVHSRGTALDKAFLGGGVRRLRQAIRRGPSG